MIIDTLKNIEENVNTEDLTHRRKGGAFDMVARIFKNVNKILFQTGTTINDRPGKKEAGGKLTSLVNSKSVFEIFQKEPTKNNFNFLVLGKSGDNQSLNTNFLNLNANSRSGENSIANGFVGFSLSRDGDKNTYKYSKIALYESSNYSDLDNLSGARVEITGQGDGGGVQITYVDNNGNIINAFVLDKDGIQLYGLSTSVPSGSNKLYIYDSGVRKYICTT